MNFKFQQRLNKDLILSRFTEEQIMEFYLHIPVKKGLQRSPLRKDEHPTCSFYRNKSGTLLFKDFATGQSLNIFGVVQYIFKCDYFTALKIIANDLGIVKDSTLSKNKGKINKQAKYLKPTVISNIQVQIQNFSEIELEWWSKYGVTPRILKKFNVFSCKFVFLNGNICAESTSTCPIYGYYGGILKHDNIKTELWRCYFPKRSSYRFITNWPSKKIQGFKQLPKKGKLLVITKSMKDTMCLYSCGVPACAPNSENLFMSDSILQDLKGRFENIIVLYDNDRPGLINMAKIRKQHPELIYTYIPKKYNSKDISDFYKNYGKLETIKLIKSFILWLKTNR